MIIRFVQFRTNDADALRLAYERLVITALRAVPGCVSATLLQNGTDRQQCISMTVWRSTDDARRYEQQGTYQSLVDAMRPFIEDSSEWRLQLGDDLTVRYEPVAEEPSVQRFAVESEGGPPEIDSRASFIRIVSHHVRPEATGEFRRIYEEQIIPALREHTSCRHAYLIADPANPATLLSVTVWTDQDKARDYELGGQFTNLLSKLEPTLTSLAQWKMDVGHGTRTRAVTSEDVSVEGYTLLAGARFPG